MGKTVEQVIQILDDEILDSVDIILLNTIISLDKDSYTAYTLLKMIIEQLKIQLI